VLFALTVLQSQNHSPQRTVLHGGALPHPETSSPDAVMPQYPPDSAHWWVEEEALTLPLPRAVFFELGPHSSLAGSFAGCTPGAAADSVVVVVYLHAPYLPLGLLGTAGCDAVGSIGFGSCLRWMSDGAGGVVGGAVGGCSGKLAGSHPLVGAASHADFEGTGAHYPPAPTQ